MKLGILDILTIIFVVCKLTGVIDWSWWLVLAPTLFSLAVAGVLIIGAVIAGILGGLR